MFAVSTLFAFVHKNDDSQQETLMEEQISLLEAFDADEACRRCLEKCRAEPLTYARIGKPADYTFVERKKCVWLTICSKNKIFFSLGV